MFGKKKDAAQPEIVEEVKEAVEETVPQPAPVKEPEPTTVIGSGVVVVGNFDSKEPIEIKGTIRGNIRSTSKVTIQEGGSLVGEAALGSLNLGGRIEGTVLCAEDTVIRSTGSIKGNLSTATLVTDEGSSFEGKLNMIPKKAE